jgi:NAD(P)-dependent dehydrogenase (short-subunit alcohol dehydrogenase family)
MTKSLEGKIAVVTGGSTGIGLATAKKLVAEGAFVFITGRRQAELDAAVSEIGANVFAVQGDVATLADLDRLYSTVTAEKGKIDILFANAAIAEGAPLGAITESHFDRHFDINVKDRPIPKRGRASTRSAHWSARGFPSRHSDTEIVSRLDEP